MNIPIATAIRTSPSDHNNNTTNNTPTTKEEGFLENGVFTSLPVLSSPSSNSNGNSEDFFDVEGAQEQWLRRGSNYPKTKTSTRTSPSKSKSMSPRDQPRKPLKDQIQDLGIDLYDYRDQNEVEMEDQPQQAPSGKNGGGNGKGPQRKRKKKKTELVRFAARTNTNNTNSTSNTNDNDNEQSKITDTKTRGENSPILQLLQKDTVSGLPAALSRRLRDFSFAQDKRRETYGYRYPWGIIGLYDHLTGIRVDVEWAEDAAWRRENGEPYLSWADFESIKDSGFNQPFFTYIVMFVCTGCLVLSIGVNGWKIEPLTENPMIGPSAQTLIDVGAKKTSLIVNDGEWYRLFSPMFLHAGVIHFVLNMLALWFVGYAVEMNHGFVSAAILFIVPAIGGTIISALFLPEYISVGASGGIFGLIGGCIADIVSNWQLLFSKQVNPVDDGKRFRHVWVLIWLLLDILLVRTSRRFGL